jgi:glycerol-3-phosphate dehydrogenase
MNERPVYDVCVIGAGIVGCAVARELSRYRVRVLLVERGEDVGLGATKANSGIVHGAYSSAHGTLKASLCRAGALMYPRLNGELAFGYRRTGALVLAFSPEEKRTIADLAANGLANGDDDLQLLGAEQVRRLEPRINPEVQAALLCPSVGVASPYEMAIALAENAIANGVELRLASEVTSLSLDDQRDGSRFRLVAGGREAAARFVVNAAGVYADRVASFVGEPGFRIVPRQGQYVLFERGTGAAVSRVIFQVPSARGKGILVTSTYHGNLMIGPNANDVEDPEDEGTSLDVLGHIVATARRSLPDFDLRQALTTFAGVRATSDTKDFVVGAGAVPGFINAGGIDSPGLTSAPAIAERVRDLLADAGLRLEPRPEFEPARRPIIVPKSLSDKEVVPLLEAPGPGRIVCRCERVTEGEILDAMSRGIPVRTIDSVKKRTRAGMGKCQGRFCRPRVAAILARESGVDDAEAIRAYEQHLASKSRALTRLVRMGAWSGAEAGTAIKP